jgi:ABC-type bacteriocin/lantibiotic exporter with double-glycine peptidase domain
MVVIAVDARFGPAYLASTVLSVLLVRMTHRSVSRAASTAQQERVGLTAILMRNWDNVALGNRHNFDRWHKAACAGIKATRAAAVKEASVTAGGSAFTAFIAMAPVLAVLLYVFMINEGRPVILATLVATLPRQILVLNHLYVLVERATSWNALAARLAGLFGATRAPSEVDLEARVSWEKIRVESEGGATDLTRSEDLCAVFRGYAPGRHTIRGPNGAGKSTILLLLKRELADDAMILPAESQLFFDADPGTLSSGQARRARLEEAAQKGGGRVLLLDEWDANLDARAIAEASAMIGNLAERHCVIEVRHRVDPNP